MNQGKLEVVKQEMARVNIGHSRNQQTKMDWMCEFNSDDQYIHYCRQESLRRNGVAIMVNKTVWNAVLGCISKTTEWFLFVFMANHFSILALRTPWTIWKGKMTGYWKRNCPGQQVPNMLLEVSGEITPEWRIGAKAKTIPHCGCDWW